MVVDSRGKTELNFLSKNEETGLGWTMNQPLSFAEKVFSHEPSQVLRSPWCCINFLENTNSITKPHFLFNLDILPHKISKEYDMNV